MVLHSGIIDLEYNPTTDILETTMPSVSHFGLSEVKFCLDLIIGAVTNYDIKKLLLDSTNSDIEMEDEAYQKIARNFGIALMKTRVQKVARIGTSDKVREEKSKQVTTQMKAEFNLPVQFKTFANRKQAHAWLLE